jgi:uncharacterized protein YjiS (DUF1127 family)
MSLSLSRIVSALTRRLVRLVAVRRAVSELRRLDDDTLADLGIARHQISAYATGRLPAPPSPRRRPLLRVIEGGRARIAAAGGRGLARLHAIEAGR